MKEMKHKFFPTRTFSNNGRFRDIQAFSGNYLRIITIHFSLSIRNWIEKLILTKDGHYYEGKSTLLHRKIKID